MLVPATETSKVPGLTSVTDDQENAVENLQAIIADLIERMRPVLRPEYAVAEGLTQPEAVPDWSPAVERLRNTERRIKGIAAMVSDVLARLDA